jgi:hypothetical protein
MRTLRTIAPLLLLLTACSPGGVTDQETDVVSFETAEPEAPYEDLEPVFFDHVRVVDPHDCVEDASFDPVTSVASLELGCPAGELDLSVGDVAVGKSDGGFALEVLDVTVVGNTVTVRGEPAPLSSMIASGGFGHTIDAFDQRSLFDISGRTLVEEEVAGVPVRLDLTRARIDLDPRLKLGSEYDCEDEELVTDENCGDLVRSALYLELRANFLVEAYAEFEREASVSGVLELARLDEPFDFWLGPVPVVGVLRIELDATWKAGATGRIQGTALGAHVTGEMDLGGEWRRGEGWSLMAERTWDAELISPSMEAEASLEMSIGLRAKASVKLYSVAGPSFWAEPYASARADAHCEGIDWTAGAGVRAGAGLNLRLFDLLGWDDSVDREWHRDLASGTIETPIPVPGLDCDGDEPAEEPPPTISDAGTCAPLTSLWCGGALGSDSKESASATSNIDGWGIAVGNYSGPEVAFDWIADRTGPVDVGLIGPRPTEMNQDIFVIEDQGAGCYSQNAIAWGPNSTTFDAVQGRTYYVVVDGFDGDAGYFAVEMDCD